VGGLRWQKFAGHLAEAGLGLDAITLDPDQLAARDPARLADLPGSTRVYGVRQPRLASERLEQGLLALWRRARAGGSKVATASSSGVPGTRPPGPRADSFSRQEILTAQVPGADFRRAYNAWQELSRVEKWAGAAAELAMTIFEPGVHRAVVSCGPPHPVHEGARLVARRTGLPLVVDLRDPWALVERLPAHIASPVWYRLAARAERQVVEDAALVVLNTEPACAAMRASHPAQAERMVAIMNGCDEEPIPGVARNERFLVAYAGSVYLDRDPRPLFQAARRLATELSLTPARFALEFMGNAQAYRGASLGQIAAEEGVGDYLRVHPPRSRGEALQFLAGASLLLSLPQDSEMAIPSKVFEYMQYDAGILALAEPDSATGVLLRDTTADCVSPRDIEGIARVLRTRYLAWRQGETPPALARDEQFTRRYQARRLLERLSPLLSPGPAPEPAWAR
jgi:hypothetical protein